MGGRAYLPYGLLSTALKPEVGRGAAHEKDQRRRPMLPSRHHAPSKQYEGRTRHHHAKHQRPSPVRRGRSSLHPRSTNGHSAGSVTPDSPRTVQAPDSPGPPSSYKEAPRARPERSTYELSLPGPGRSTIWTIPTIECLVLYLFFISSSRVPRVSPVSAHADYKRASGTPGLRRTAGRTLHPHDSFPLAAQLTRDLGDPPSLEQFVTPYYLLSTWCKPRLD